MFKNIFVIILLIGFVSCNKSYTKQKISDEVLIKNVLEKQRVAWNQGNLDTFMEGYWKSEKLKFTGGSGTTYGYEKTLLNYKKGYPNKEKMGTLYFTIGDLDRLSKDCYSMIGTFELQRKNDNPSGYFTLIWKKINGKWKIISDITCG